MASAAMNAVAHSVPSPYAIPLGPRIRPPRLLPGTKAENTNPQPSGPVPENSVWVQGKWRNPASNAAKDRRLLQSKQVEKALRHHTHGMNIYAYRQIRTNQVVYSLTRVMQNTKILPQLVYHRKKTVPASLRRDVWRPYFSIHFPQTPAGAQAGLRAYQYLRELALKRQLSPPPEILVATEEDVEKARKRYSPLTLRDKLQKHELKDLPRLNQMLPPRWRAKKLMDQTATSVADVSFVLGVLNVDQNPTERLAKIEENRIKRHKERTPRDRRRINQIREREETTAEKIEERQKILQARPGQEGLDRHVAQRIAIEYGGALLGNGHVGSLQDIQLAKEKTAESRVPSVKAALREAKPVPFDAVKYRANFTEEWNRAHDAESDKPAFPEQQLDAEIKEKQLEYEQQEASFKERAADIARLVKEDKQKQIDASRAVYISWADKRDGTYAEEWPEEVYHGWLDPKAVLKRQLTVVRQDVVTDADGQEISEQKQDVLVQGATSSHIFGRDTEEKWFQSPAEQDEAIKETMTPRSEYWEQTRRERVIKEMIELRAKSFGSGDEQTAAVASSSARLAQLEARYPGYKPWLDDLKAFSDVITELEKVREKERSIPTGMSRNEVIDEIEALEEEVRIWDMAYPGYQEPETTRQRALADIKSGELEIEKLKLDDDEEALQQIDDINQELSVTAQGLEQLEREVLDITVDAVLDRHKASLISLEDPNAVNAAITLRSVEEDKRRKEAQEEANAKMSEKELSTMGVHVDQKEPRKGVWGTIKGFIGR